MRHASRLLGSLALALFGLAGAIAPIGAARAQTGTWSDAGLSVNAGPRREYAAVFDRESQRYIVFGGLVATDSSFDLSNDVWALDVSGTPTWSHLTIDGPSPGERHSPQWGYDVARNRVLLFGGYGSNHPGDPLAYLNDVWELSLAGTPQWTELTPTGQAPDGQLAGAAVFDPMRQRFVGFGGIYTPAGTWVLNLRHEPEWQVLPVGSAPSAMWGMSSIYDGKRDRMVTFGGTDGAYGGNSEVWELKLRGVPGGVPEWHVVTTTGTPPPARRSGTAIYDALRDRMVIYGGVVHVPYSAPQFFGDAWALDFTTDPPAWSQLLPAGTTPIARDLSSAAYDAIHDRMIVYGGWSGSSMLSDTEFLDWGGSSTEASLTPTSSATPSVAHVEWTVAQATGGYAAVYRKDPGGEWTAHAEGVVTDGTLAYDDGSVVPGNAYSYMMVVQSQRGETFGGEVSVSVPATTGVGDRRIDLALAGAFPNPAFDRMSVVFTLASGAPATLELVDVSGRRVLGRDVGTLGAGEHRIDLTTIGQVAPGLYFLRLRQAGRVASSRVAVAGSR